MGLWATISGKKPSQGNALCFVLGSDQRFARRMMALQGSHLQDDANRLAYFSSPESIGTFRRINNGIVKTMNPVSVACDLVTELYSFTNLNWIPDRLKNKDDTNGHHSQFERDEVLDNGLAEGFALAHQKRGDEETRRKVTHILLLTVLGAFFMFLLVGASTGLLSNLFSGIGKVFGG